PRLSQALALDGPLGIGDLSDLEQVANFLRSQGVRDGEVLCFHDTTHPLCLNLDIEPAARFLQFNFFITAFPEKRETVRAELRAARPRFIVSDLFWAGLMAPQYKGGEPATTPGLPPEFPKGRAHLYPWCEPVVFRAGRYVVHRATGPVGKFWED